MERACGTKVLPRTRRRRAIVSLKRKNEEQALVPIVKKPLCPLWLKNHCAEGAIGW